MSCKKEHIDVPTAKGTRLGCALENQNESLHEVCTPLGGLHDNQRHDRGDGEDGS